MLIFFFTLTLITTGLAATAFYNAYAGATPLYHFYFGLITVVSSLITHTWVFFYFIGTGEGIREGVTTHKLSLDAVRKTKRFKATTFPFALFAMIFMIVAAILGGALRFQRVPAAWHLGFAVFATAFNLLAFYREFRAIQTNQRLMAGLNEEIEMR